MPTIKHPTLENVTYEVPKEDLKAWKDQGWIEDKPAKSDKS